MDTGRRQVKEEEELNNLDNNNLVEPLQSDQADGTDAMIESQEQDEQTQEQDEQTQEEQQRSWDNAKIVYQVC